MSIISKKNGSVITAAVLIISAFVASNPVRTDAASTFKKLFKDYSDKKTVKTVAGHKVRNGNGNLDIMYSGEKFWRPSSVYNYTPVFSDGTDIYYTENKKLMKFNFELHSGDLVCDFAVQYKESNQVDGIQYALAAFDNNKFYINKTGYDIDSKIISYDLKTGETTETDGSIIDHKGRNLLVGKNAHGDSRFKSSYYLCKFSSKGIKKIKKINKYDTAMMSYAGKDFYFLEIAPKKKKMFLKTCKTDGSGLKTLKTFKYSGSAFSLSYQYNKNDLTFKINNASYKLTYKNNKVTKTK